MRVITLIAVITILIELITCKIAGKYYRASERDLRLFGTRREKKIRKMSGICTQKMFGVFRYFEAAIRYLLGRHQPQDASKRSDTSNNRHTPAKAGTPPAEGDYRTTEMPAIAGMPQ